MHVRNTFVRGNISVSQYAVVLHSFACVLLHPIFYRERVRDARGGRGWGRGSFCKGVIFSYVYLANLVLLSKSEFLIAIPFHSKIEL